MGSLIIEFTNRIWGLPLLILLIGGGIFFFFYSGLAPFRHLKHAIQILIGKYDNPDDPGDINHYEALSTALASTIGMGNISGVAIAIATGGPGATRSLRNSHERVVMKRRKFLRALGAGTAGIAAFSCADQDEASRIQRRQVALADADLEWKKAPCRYCGTGCGVEVGLDNGRIMAVRGDEANPVNRGMLCVKGYHLPAMLYGEDRLRYPMLRNANGRGWP